MPLLIGVSRKSMLGQLTGADVGERVEASIAAHLVAAAQGADVLRVHDVRQTAHLLETWDSLAREESPA